MAKRIKIKDRFGFLPSPVRARRIVEGLPSGERKRLERAWRAWWDPEKGLVVEPRPS